MSSSEHDDEGSGDASQWLPGDSAGPSSYREAMDARQARGSIPTGEPKAKVRSIWRRAGDSADGTSFAGFYVEGHQLVARDRSYISLLGASAVVEAGMQSSRSTATRVVGGLCSPVALGPCWEVRSRRRSRKSTSL